ncbi:hypothetical protein BDF21DRAFT_462382 [Thamnidium elegans]|nr:hypothetical protein BDF21DRAFT_462382 [Thamnidium elegans]
MEDTSSIYWTLMETDTDNSELYFPPDTPVGGANPKKLYSLYQKRHARQKERLIKLQVAELYKYRENFSTDFKDDNSLNTPSTVCELISGTDFLTNESEAISQLLFGIPNFITQNQNQKRPKPKPENTDTQKEEYLEDLTKRFKAGSGNLEKNHQLQLDSLERLQKSDISSIPREVLIELDPKRYDRKRYSSSPESAHNDRRRYKDGRRDDKRDRKRRRDDYRARSPIRDNRREKSPLRDSHRTKSYTRSSSSSPPPPPPPPPPQRGNYREQIYTSSFPPLSPPPPPLPPPSSTPTQRGSNREPIYTSSLSTSSSLTQLKQPPVVSIVGIPANARPPTVISSSTTATPNKSDPPTLKNSSFKSPAKPLKVSASSINKSGPPTVHSSNPRLPTAGSSVTHISTARPPAMIPSSVNKSGPPTVHFSPIRPPPTVQFSSFKSTGRPPSVGSSSAIGVPSNSKVPTFNLQFKNPAYNNVPPYIAQPSSQFTQPNDMKYNEHRSYTPLFTPRPPRKIETLLDKGSLLIYNKPCRVLIRQPNGTAKAYGNPKDYDDAIHSRTTRPDNPVYKRHMNGADYLFYKTDSGNVVTIGSVSKIQPLIHKYFLSV